MGSKQKVSVGVKLGFETRSRRIGRICCRLPQPSLEIQELGKFLKNKLENGDLTFLVTEKYREERTISSVSLTSDVVNGMIKEFYFDVNRMTVTVTSKLSQTEIFLSFGKDDCFPISRFPRSLFSDEQQSTGKLVSFFCNSRAQ